MAKKPTKKDSDDKGSPLAALEVGDCWRVPHEDAGEAREAAEKSSKKFEFHSTSTGLLIRRIEDKQ